MSRNSALASMATIDQFVNHVGHVKAASEKAADAPKSEPGSIGGETTHPVKSVDDRLKEVPEGERSKENTKDVKDAVGAPSVENAAEASTKNAAAQVFGVAAKFAKKAEGGAVSTPGSAADDHISTTTKVAPTGEDSANETSSAKAGKEDKKQGGMGGTTHPASTENDSLDGHKYASAPLEKLSNDLRDMGNTLLAQLHNVYQNAGAAAPQSTKQAAAAAPAQKTAGDLDPRLAYMAGSELAGLLSGTMDKRAADQMVQDTLALVVKQAADDAELFTNYARDFLKRAEGEEGAETDPSAGGGGEELAAPGGEGGAGGGGEEAMMAALGGGAGGDPMGGGAPGGDPMGGGGGGDAEAQQLAQILEQLGVTPEELQAALAEQAGGGMGGGDPMGGAGGMGGGDPMAAMGGMGGAGGGAPPPPPGGGGAPPMPGMEAQASAGGGKRNNGQQKIASAAIAAHIQEIISRSRAKR